MVESHAKEWNRGCQQLIRDHVEWCAAVLGTVLPLPCLFEDVEGCVPPNSYNKDDPYMVKYRAIAAADLLSHGKCLFHGKQCPLFGPAAAADWETAGLPCTDQSRAGLRRFEHGPTASVFICHAKRHIELETPVILLENVQDTDGLCSLFRALAKY